MVVLLCRARRLALALLVVSMLFGAATAFAQSSATPLNQFPQEPTPPTTTTATTSTSTASTNGGSISTGDYIAIGVVGVLLIAGIVYVIMRDAKTAAPTRSQHFGGRARGTVAPRDERIKRSRARAKAARKARKRSR